VSTVEGVRPTLLDMTGLDVDYMMTMKEVLSNILKLKTNPSEEQAVILCGEGIEVSVVSQAAIKIGYFPVSFPPSNPTSDQRQKLREWLRGGRGLLVTSNIQFSGMETMTCVFITKWLVKETGTRSGLLRATARLIVVSFTEDIEPAEVKKSFLMHDMIGVKEMVKKREKLLAEVDNAVKKGNIARARELQKLDTTGTPFFLELRSTSGAGDYCGSRLGLYRTESLRQGLVFRQLHDDRGGAQQNYLYRSGDYWWVSDKVGGEKNCYPSFQAYMRAKVGEADQLVPPVQGWQFLDDDDKWCSDPTLECSRELSEPCKDIIIELRGEVERILPKCKGRFRPVDGVFIRGRPVSSFEKWMMPDERVLD